MPRTSNDVPFTNYRSGATGVYFRARKFTLNEGQPSEVRGYQTFYGALPLGGDDVDTTEALVIESRSESPGHPFALRLKTLGDDGYVAEGGKQVAELLVLLIDQAAYAEGIPPAVYAARLFERTGARV